jgi:hypothetical protein
MALSKFMLLFLLPLSVALLVQGAEASPAPDAADVKALFERLSAEDFETREEATAQLVKMGAPVLPMLENLAKDAKDMEVLDRYHSIRATIVGIVARPVAYVAAPGAVPPAKAGPNIQMAAMNREDRTGPDSPVLILDGQASSGAPGGRMRYAWKQTAGEDLELKPEKLVRPRVGLLIYHPGEYRFQLVVSDGRNTSAPAEVVVRVDDPGAEKSDVQQ